MPRQSNYSELSEEELANLGEEGGFSTRLGARMERRRRRAGEGSIYDFRQQEQGELERLEKERANESPYLRQRSQAAFEAGRRQIQEGERGRLRETETGLAQLGLSESPVGEAFRRRERETTAREEGDLLSQVTTQELGAAFQAEQAAIDNLFRAGQAGLAFERQRLLTQMQIDATLRLADRQGRREALSAIGQLLGSLTALLPIF